MNKFSKTSYPRSYNQNNFLLPNNNVPRQNFLNNVKFQSPQKNETDHNNIISEKVKKHPKFGEYIYWLIQQDVPNMLNSDKNFIEFKDIISKKIFLK